MSDQQHCPHLTPNTGDWHLWNVGMLIAQLQSLEFSARIAIATMTGTRSGADLRALQPGQWASEDPITNYDQLTTVLAKFNGLVSARQQLNVAEIVNLRDQLAHGRVASGDPTFPLILLKFGRSLDGKVPVLARIEMTETWFANQWGLVFEALQTVYLAAR